MYLTGKLKEIKGNEYYTNAKKNENTKNWESSASSYKKRNANDDIEEAVNILNDYAKKETQITAGKLEELLRKFGHNTKDIINKLVSENKLIDNDDFYEIIS